MVQEDDTAGSMYEDNDDEMAGAGEQSIDRLAKKLGGAILVRRAACPFPPCRRADASRCTRNVMPDAGADVTRRAHDGPRKVAAAPRSLLRACARCRGLQRACVGDSSVGMLLNLGVSCHLWFALTHSVLVGPRDTASPSYFVSH